MRLDHVITILILFTSMVACGPRDRTVSASAEASTSQSGHPLIGTWNNTAGGQDLVIRKNGSSLSQACGSQGMIGEVDESSDCGANSKACGSFPYVVTNGNIGPNCMEAGSYVCFYNVYTNSSQDYLAVNCSDGKGPIYFQRAK